MLNLMLALALFALCFHRAILDYSHGSFDILDLRHWFLTYYFLEFGAWPVHLVAFGKPRLLESLDLGLIAATQIVAIIGAILFLLPSYLSLTPNRATTLKLWLNNSRIPQPVLVGRKAAIYAGIGAAYFALAAVGVVILVSHTSGISYYLTHINEVRLTTVAGFTGARYMVNLSLVGVVCLFIAFRGRGAVVPVVAAFIAAAANALFAHRAQSALIGIIVLGYFWYRTRNLSIGRILIFAGLFLFANAVFVAYRSSTDTTSTGQVHSGSVLGDTFLSRFHGTESLIAVWRHEEPTTPSAAALQPVVDLIYPFLPPSLRGSLQPTSDRFNKNYVWWYQHGYGGKAGGFAVTLLAESVILFGALGASLCMLLLGYLAKSVYERFSVGAMSDGKLYIYLVLLYFFTMINESVMGSVAKFLAISIPLCLTHYLVERFHSEST